MCWVMILCRLGIHRFRYWKVVNQFSPHIVKFRQCKCCLKKWKWSHIRFEFTINSRTGEINQPISKWMWKVVEPSKEDIRQIRLRKLGI